MSTTQKLQIFLVFSTAFILFICLILVVVSVSASLTTQIDSLRSLSPDLSTDLTPTETEDFDNANLKDSPKSVEPTLTLNGVELYPCRVDNENYLFWGTVSLTNNSQDLWYNGSFRLRFLNSDGDEIGTRRGEAIIPSNTESLVAHDKITRYAYTFELTEPEFHSIKLEYKTDIQRPNWNFIDPFVDDYKWQSELNTHTFSSEQYPKHKIAINVTNTGSYKLHRVMGFAVIYNSEGEIADLLWSEPTNQWPYGHSIRKDGEIVLSLTSLAVKGTCLAPLDPNGYVIEYQIHAITAGGYPLNTSIRTSLQ